MQLNIKKLILQLHFILALSWILSGQVYGQTQNFREFIENQSKSDPSVHKNPFHSLPGGMPNDNIAEKNHTLQKSSEMIPQIVRECDITWSKRVWRYIDLNQRLNQELKNPINATRGRRSLFDVLVRSFMLPDIEHPNKDRLALFEWNGTIGDFTFDIPIRTNEQLLEKLKYKVTLPTGLDSGYFQPADIIGYRIMEEWFFDKKRSQLDVRILALAPLTYGKMATPAGNVKPNPNDRRVLFITYFPQAQWFLNRYEVFNEKNNSEYRTFYQIFLMRRFSSFVYKEENVHDRLISDYALGIDALLESERIENQIQEFEFDLWEE